jgi:formylglycine-generating enzyme required for sulfatase activity
VLDFGMSRMSDAESSQQRPRGPRPKTTATIGYAAPEQLGNAADADERSDIYGLGCTLYFLLAGKPPQNAAATNPPGDPALPPLESPREPIPAALQTIYGRMTALDRNDRYATADDLIHDLDSFLAGTRISARMPRWFTKAALGVAAALVIGAGVWFVAPWRQPTGAGGNDGVVRIDGPLPAPLEGPASEEAVLTTQKAWSAALGSPVEIRNNLGMTFRLIPPGSMLLGTPDGQIDERLGQLVAGTADWQWLREYGAMERPRSRVALAQPFYLGTTEVTVAQFRAFVDATSHQTTAETDGRGGVSYSKGLLRRQSPGLTWRTPGYTHQTDAYPVVQVSVADAAAFCRWLGKRDQRPYALPSESQWEYACRAGHAERWFWGNDADAFTDYAWPPEPDWYGPRPVAGKRPNALGLFDMAGNVAEWTEPADASPSSSAAAPSSIPRRTASPPPRAWTPPTRAKTSSASAS